MTTRQGNVTRIEHSSPGRRPGRPGAALFALLACCAAAAASTAAAGETAPAPRTDASLIGNLLDAASQPILSLDPMRRYALLVHERKLLELRQLSEPVVAIAGRNINPRTYGPHAPLDYFALTLVDLQSGASEPIPLPRGATVGFPIWSPNGAHFAFTLTEASGTGLWIGEPGEGRARKLLDHLNASLGLPCAWMPDGRRLLCREVGGRRPLATATTSTPSYPPPFDAAFMLGQTAVVDEPTVRELFESQLVLIDSISGQRHEIGAKAAFEAVEAAPSGGYLLVTRVRSPYPRISGVDRLDEVVEVWDKLGRVVARLPDGLRAVQWHPSMPATLAWVERDGDADRVVLQYPPFTAPPVEIFRTANRFAGIDWIEESGAALVRDYSPSERARNLWYARADAPGSEPRLLRSASIDDPLDSIGSPMTRMNRWGKSVTTLDGQAFFMRGEAPTPQGPRAFLARVDIASGKTERIWHSTHDGLESVVDLLTSDARLLLTRRESPEDPPNYFVDDALGHDALQLTHYSHPAPELKDAQRLALRYQRADGYSLSSSLYLPPHTDASEPLPLVVWAYPRRLGENGDPAAMHNREGFMTINRAFKLVFLLRGYAVMDDVSMPIIGSNSDANDTFVQQVVANAEAAIGAATQTGVIDPNRIGIAGYSYGAFMAANLLAHSQLFKAGIALSGAYNRTLTPFGFQTERRTLWEAPDTYLAMSPLLYSNRITAPLLLVHGLQDQNSGTSPLQSTQFYQAIRGNGGEAKLLLLPWEGHAYRAKESVTQAATAMLSWFDRYLE